VARRILALLPFLPASLLAQEPEWNSERALELLGAARQSRLETAVDTTFRSYEAEARGYVSFFIDRPDEAERTLVKKDQIALEVFWRAPNDTKQRIVGHRDRKVLPTSIRYHLDHLTVVQDEFGDLIRLGDGDEVEAVLHPMAPGSERLYDVRLTDSLTLSFPGGREPVRVYELEVRPRDLERPGFVGSVFIDRTTSAIVRMSFTFTPASYVDPYLDYIRISLDNGLWLGRYWLPYRQEVELRRELPQLDFLAGSIIRGRFEIGAYEFNGPLDDALFRSRGVSAVPEAERRAFPFEEPLFSGSEADDLDPSQALRDIERQARRLAVRRTLSGLRRLRLFVPSISDGIRYDRAEGLFLGMGMAFRPRPELGARVHGGWAFEAEQGSLVGELTGGEVHPRSGIAIGLHELRDLGPIPGASRLVNSVAALAGEDYTDPYFASGARAFHRFGAVGATGLDVTARWERQESAVAVVGDRALRPVRPVDDGTLVALDVGVDVAGLPSGLLLRSDGRLGRLEGETYVTAQARASWRRERLSTDVEVEVDVRAGAVGAGAPSQELYLLGGRETIPGHAYRGLVGDRYWLIQARAGRALRAPWAELHVFAAAGRAWLVQRDALPDGWAGVAPPGTRASVGVGMDLLWEVLRVDLARGLGTDGEWELVLAVSHRFQPWL
jgi:hypothetical protein